MPSSCFTVTEPTLVTATATFRDEDDALIDPPGGVEVEWLAPDGTSQTFVYTVDAEVIRVSTGIYKMSLLIDQVGIWWVIWTAPQYVSGEEQLRAVATH